MPLYSEKVMDHFKNPRNVGEIKDADGVGEVGNPVCGDMMTFYIKVNNGRVEDVKFKTFGCGAAIAVSSMVSEMAKGMTLEQVMNMTNDDVARELGGLPPNKMHCSNLGADALHRAIEDYKAKQDKAVTSKPAASSCSCSCCGSEGCGSEVRKPCSVAFKDCPSCGQRYSAEFKECPQCSGNSK